MGIMRHMFRFADSSTIISKNTTWEERDQALSQGEKGLNNHNIKKYIAQFIGTFALVFFGAGSIIINQLSAGLILHAGIFVIFGLVVLIMSLAFGSISGAHINPAVSFGFFIEGQLDKKIF